VIKMRVGVLTGGGDCPGLNAVIYGILLQAHKSKKENLEIVGIKKGWKIFTMDKNEILKVKDKYTKVLKIEDHDDLQTKGGTILYTSRSNPFKAVSKLKTQEEKDKLSEEIGKDLTSKFETIGIDALIAIGGDDTCGVAAAMYKFANAQICTCPKTIDNDLAGTNYTFGFLSGAQLASNRLDDLTTTAHSHQRILVVEIMGRDAGWLTLYSGISSGSDIILIPETPFDFKKHIVDILAQRAEAGYKFHIIACSEGAFPCKESIDRDFHTVNIEEKIANVEKGPFGNPLLSKLGMASIIVDELKANTKLKAIFEANDCAYEIRPVVLGYTMRAGTPNVFDRVLGLRYGYHAMKYVLNGNFGKMTALKGVKIKDVDLIEGSKKSLIDPASDLIEIRNEITSVKQKSKRGDLFD
jgi:ATP-dependent phosphofructokinase / diphosphate-dependent phosphofructokinase